MQENIKKRADCSVSLYNIKKRKTTFHIALRLILGALFFWAGLAKLPEPEAFAGTIHAFDLLPHPLILPFAILIPWIELVVGLCLALGLWTRTNAVILLCLLCAFSIALGISIHRNADISCGCFGVNGYGFGESLRVALARNLVLISGALILAFTRNNKMRSH